MKYILTDNSFSHTCIHTQLLHIQVHYFMSSYTIAVVLLPQSVLHVRHAQSFNVNTHHH